MEYVIYAAYGSNLLTERLLTYIKGGKFRELPKWHAGCPDKTEPVSLGWKWIPYRVYFGGYSGQWGGGVAFLSTEIEPNTEYHAVVRLWKMKREQYECVKSQEGESYAKEIKLGTIDGLKILAFTSEKKLNYNSPSKLYLDVLKEGLKESSPLYRQIFQVLRYLSIHTQVDPAEGLGYSQGTPCNRDYL